MQLYDMYLKMDVTEVTNSGGNYKEIGGILQKQLL